MAADIWDAPPAPPVPPPPMDGPAFLFTEMYRRGIRVAAEKKEDGLHWKLQGDRKKAAVRSELDSILEGAPERADEPAEEWGDEWEDLAGSMADAIKESWLLFTWGVAGLVSSHEFLTCNQCGATQVCHRKDGTPSASKRCIMTIQCKGKMKRFPNYIFTLLGKKRHGGGARGIGSTKKGIPMDIRLEALEIADRLGNMSEAARQMAVKYPDYKFSAAGVKYWREQRKTSPETYK